MKMKRTLAEINADYESILHSSSLTNYRKAVKFADLLTEMEGSYKVPMLRNPEWEKQNKPVIALYRKISLSRAIDDEE
jgi:hypothetical protein